MISAFTPQTLLAAALGVATIGGMLYLWILTVISSDDLLRPRFGRMGTFAIAIGVPAAFLSLFSAIAFTRGLTAAMWPYTALLIGVTLYALWFVGRTRSEVGGKRMKKKAPR